MKKKKGFTMVELLAVIVIIGILSVVGTVTATNIINKARREYYKKQESLILLSGKEYYSDYRSKLPKQVGGTGEVTLKTLVGEKYIKPVEGYQNHSCDVEKSAVYVQKLGESNYVYSILMDCDDYNTSTSGSNPVITFLPNSKRSNKAITVEMRVKDDRGISAYNYIVYKLGSKEDSEGEIIEQIPVKSEWDGKAGKEPYNKVIKIKLEEDGIYKIRGTAWDNEENAATKDSGIYEIDTTPPDCKKLVINTDYKEKMTGENWTSKNVKLTLDFGQVGEIESWDWETNKDSRKCTWDYITKNEQLDQIVTGKNSSFYYQSNNKPSTKTKTISGEGARQGRITLYDEFGNSCKVTTEKFLIDKNSPTVTLKGSTANGKVTNKDVRLTATPSPKCARSGYTYVFERNENGTWVEVSRQASNQYTVHIEYNQEIDYQYRVRVITGAGEEGRSSQYRVHIDKIPPKCDMVSFSPNGKTWTNQDISVTVKTNNNDIKTFDVLRNLNSAGYATYQYARSGASSTLTLSEEGIHYLQVRGYDEAGNTCEVNATSNPYYIDKTKPSCSISLSGTTGNNGWYKANNVTVTLLTQENGTYQSQVNGYDLTTSGSASYSGRASGSQGNTTGVTWHGYVRDAAGNTNTCSSGSFKVDTASPTCSAVSNHTGWTNQNVTVTGRCSDTGGSGCAGNSTTTVSSDTNGNIQPPNVQDKAGNVGVCNSVLVQRDTSKPTCSISLSGTAGSNGWYKANNVTVTLSVQDGGTVHAPVQKGLTTTNSANYNGKTTESQGNTSGVTWYGFVKDQAGNTGKCNSTSFKVDTTPPTCTPTGTGAINKWGKSATLTGQCSDTGGSGCQGNSTKSVTTNTAGAVTVPNVQDKAGNTASCGSLNVYVDITPPSCSPQDISASGGRKNGLEYRINCSDSGGSGVSTCAGVAGNHRDYTNQKTSGGPFYAVDAAGNTSVACYAPIKEQWKKHTCKTCGTCNSTCKTHSACSCSKYGYSCSCTCYDEKGFQTNWFSGNYASCRSLCKNKLGSRYTPGSGSCTYGCIGTWQRASSCPCEKWNQQTSCKNCGCGAWYSAEWSDSACTQNQINNHKCKYASGDYTRWVKNW